MKKLLLVACVITLLTSCYNTRVYVGDVSKTEPLVEINKEWNHHFICGLVSGDNAKMAVKAYVEGYDSYVVKTNTGFLHGLVGTATFGIYTPTQTTYYIPLRILNSADRQAYLEEQEAKSKK